MISNYKHIIWDWNGTLFNDVELSVSIVNNLLIKRNLIPLSVEKYKEIFTFPVKDYYVTAGFDFEKESFEIVGKEWMDEYERRKHGCGLSKSAFQLLEKISSLKIEQSILSAYSQHTLVEVVEHFGLTKYFSHLLGLDNIYASSKVKLGKELMKKLALNNGEALLIGDTIHDFNVAAEIGADCILVASGHQSRKNLERCGVPVFDSIKELLEII
ncbi:MAG: phosphatase [Ignavibacteria bacterium CG22_combo_CG10-13_8_21_14_all_37_15]|nr:HAD family hydrolase [Ignavibacteria bacterium]OIO13651.1 MAG: phosphatase [Ignavibacteria bacterium CG1_02_37_35]PIP77903.1 MAG: phosphatase [Ignavibacteria bacterium CG22_combo_CG10-13_8_21_14_all_37_15]PIS43916.1 MAG: HAD family hydrolase [Ignavibacteria bacterium CG08_land_8_20_14_0_20_37_9]PJC59846.1 MAG: HAD family hydrolase [Ignavibacteria bacterium CG_4_9_14_0_2_um_filter_37_13]